ncbi:MAG TPA: cytochrome (ubi)quinol oxidase subunit III [Candidatus Paceibacterota bacterium]|nr:cytochrome (ubi)quinol oxidase subunit III [Candidatus Paceibacterota bacterium]
MTTDTETIEQLSADARVVFGFWAYLLTDLVLFASLFATYAVLEGGTFGGPGPHQLFDVRYAFIETMLLLTSSFVAGLGMIAAHEGAKRRVLAWFAAAFILGAGFLGMETAEFAHLAAIGATPSASAFLSSYFTLLGTHGLHVAIGLVWMGVLLVWALRRPWDHHAERKFMLLSLFWHFLDIIWVLIFTVVYLFGLMS